MKKIHSKLKALEWSQHFSHYKSIGIFPNAQGQVTHKSLVRSFHTIRTTTKAWMSLNFGKIPLLTSELAALELQKN